MRYSIAAALAFGAATMTPALAQNAQPVASADGVTILDNGWSYGAQGDSCIARYTGDDEVSLTIGFSKWGPFQGSVFMTSENELPFIPEELQDIHPERLTVEETEDDSWLYVRIDPAYSFDTFPGTALFIDGDLASFSLYATGDDEEHQTEYRFSVYEPQVIEMLRGTETITVVGKGEQRWTFPADGSAPMADFLESCMAEG